MDTPKNRKFTYVPYGFTPLTEKPCRTCGTTKPVAAFYERLEQPLWRPGRWHHDCIECYKAKTRAKYHLDAEASAADKLRRVHRLIERRKAEFLPGLSTTLSPEQRFAKRWPKIRKAHLRSWIRYSMPRTTPPKSFRDQAYRRRVQESAARQLARLEATESSKTKGSASQGPGDNLADWLAAQRARIWADDGLCPKERLDKLQALRSAYPDD
ncbi:hypothetical protein [Cupriavidus alkaliphilus]|uniref:hypothetical protein n=1 Tax=Cupriavidus alkaliphilus TaxID=942866 RepID=UPI00339D6BBE